MPPYNHTRRHSWPYCGSGMRLRDRRNLPVITVTGPPEDVETEFLTPVIPEDLLEDDAAAAGIVRSQTTGSHRHWYHSSHAASQDEKSIGTVSLRRIVQPPLDRARSLFMLPTVISAGEAALLPYWVHRLSKHPISIKEKDPRNVERGRLIVDKNHRRCHSERPRSWKQPSEKLWTLKEE
ncbi:hypothetical protein BJY04DRAFT_221583 [Aspergillus karnatakaensis]|uniref:uncharacterized protein n=1 Tax=Aspergillus karnatakaensis TaxID=1810916 RepID=UPI003CCCD894